MAFINNTYVFVSDEQVSRGVEVSEHPVESGLDVTDNIKRSPVAISISGEIVGNNAASVLSLITGLHQGGKLVKYSGRNILKNAIIERFDTSHPAEIYGGCAFDMVIREIRVAKSAYVPPVASTATNTTTKKATVGGTQQVEKNSTSATYHKVKKGESLWSIAKAYYGSGTQWKKIAEANGNPKVIYPYDKNAKDHKNSYLLIP